MPESGYGNIILIVGNWLNSYIKWNSKGVLGTRYTNLTWYAASCIMWFWIRYSTPKFYVGQDFPPLM